MGRFGILGLYSVLGILFFSSGFTAFTRKDHPLPEFIKGKFISIMVPYFAFCFLTLAIRAFMLEMSVGEIIAWTRGILSGVRNQVPLAAMWFMPCLFCMEIYHHVLCLLYTSVRVEDVLGRDEIELSNYSSALVNNKVVMVTGGGGSIGSEDVYKRQLL